MKNRKSGETKTVDEESEGAQLSRYLMTFSRIDSRNHAKRVLSTGKVSVNGEFLGQSSAGLRLHLGDVVAIDWDRPGTSKPHAKAQRDLFSRGLEILHEDKAVVALDKPSGLLTDAATTKQARERATARKWMTAYLKPQGKRAVVVHRIDRDTSGVVLFAKDMNHADKIREAFRERTIDRIYWVAVQGGPEEDEGRWEDQVYWDAKRKVLRRAMQGQRGAKDASARFRVIDRFQCQERGYPLCGERLYLPMDWRPVGFPCPRQALHARKLAFDHPQSGKRIVVESSLPDDLSTWLERLRREKKTDV